MSKKKSEKKAEERKSKARCPPSSPQTQLNDRITGTFRPALEALRRELRRPKKRIKRQHCRALKQSSEVRRKHFLCVRCGLLRKEKITISKKKRCGKSCGQKSGLQINKHGGNSKNQSPKRDELICHEI